MPVTDKGLCPINKKEIDARGRRISKKKGVKNVLDCKTCKLY